MKRFLVVAFIVLACLFVSQVSQAQQICFGGRCWNAVQSAVSNVAGTVKQGSAKVVSVLDGGPRRSAFRVRGVLRRVGARMRSR